MCPGGLKNCGALHVTTGVKLELASWAHADNPRAIEGEIGLMVVHGVAQCGGTMAAGGSRAAGEMIVSEVPPADSRSRSFPPSVTPSHAGTPYDVQRETILTFHCVCWMA